MFFNIKLYIRLAHWGTISIDTGFMLLEYTQQNVAEYWNISCQLSW